MRGQPVDQENQGLLWPVFEFRPLPDEFTPHQGRPLVRRFADGKWIEDDGEYDVAFIGYHRGAPIALYVALPYKKNIILQWTTGHWSCAEPRHPRNNAWHYMLRDGAQDFGASWSRDRHPNCVAGEKAMNKLSSEAGCANGRHVEMHLDDRHIKAGLLRDRASKEIYKHLSPVCVYCGPTEPLP